MSVGALSKLASSPDRSLLPVRLEMFEMIEYDMKIYDMSLKLF